MLSRLNPAFARSVAAEMVGTALLATIVVGSGLAAERLSEGNVVLALLFSAISTGAGLAVLILILGPISGAQFNPIVSLVLLMRGQINLRTAGVMVVFQTVGALVGVAVAHAMFADALLQASGARKDGAGLLLSETVAAFGLILTVLGTARFRPDAMAASVGLYVASAYAFTASTAFANPALTLARSVTDSFAGIAIASVPAFIVAQIAGALLAALLGQWLFSTSK